MNNTLLTEENKEALIILMEGCSELAIEASKIIRFGTEAKKDNLKREFADLLCMMHILEEQGFLVFDEEKMDKMIEDKREKLKIWSNLFVDK